MVDSKCELSSSFRLDQPVKNVGAGEDLSRVGFLGELAMKPLVRPMERLSSVRHLRRLPRPISPKNLPVKAGEDEGTGNQARRIGAGAACYV
jgi:hypothetical protein